MSTLLELIAYPRMVLLKTATWPNSEVSLSYRLRTAFTMGNILLLTLCLMYNAIFYLNDFVKLSESLYMLISMLNTFIKVAMLSIKGDELLKLIDYAECFRNYDEIYGNLVKNSKKDPKKIEIIFRILLCGSLLFTILYPAFESKPLPFDFPHFNNGTLHYPFYIFEAVSLCIAAYNNIALDLLAVGVMSLATIQLKILNAKLADTEKNVKLLPNYAKQNEEWLVLGYVNECCKHYSEIEEFVKYILKVFSINMFVQLGTSIIAICNSGMTLLNVQLISFEAAGLLFYLLGMFIQLGMYCWFGNLVYLESLKIPTSCYMSPWHKHKTAISKSLFMLMERAKRPLEIRGLNFVILSLDTFITILKWSYSYFTLLRNYAT